MTKNVNVVSLVVALLGAVKLILNAFGLDVINDQQINDIANGVAAIVTVVGIIVSHEKKDNNGNAGQNVVQ